MAWSREEALLHLVDSIRHVIEGAVTTAAPALELSSLAAALDRVADDLHRSVDPAPWDTLGDSSALHDPCALRPLSMVHGPYSPLAPPVEVEMRDGVVRGHVTFGSAYLGRPGIVHGGMVAAVFDQLLALPATMSSSPDMTASLTVRYLAPAPLHRELLFEAWTDSVDGRKRHAKGRGSVGASVFAEAEGLYVVKER